MKTCKELLLQPALLGEESVSDTVGKNSLLNIRDGSSAQDVNIIGIAELKKNVRPNKRSGLRKSNYVQQDEE